MTRVEADGRVVERHLCEACAIAEGLLVVKSPATLPDALPATLSAFGRKFRALVNPIREEPRDEQQT